MAEEIAAEAAQDALDTPAGDAGEQTGADAADPVETKARAMGWDPDKGPLSAEDFVKRGDEIAGFVKKHNGKLERELADMRKTLAEAKEYFSKSEERAYKRASDDLKAKHAQAVEVGDVEAAQAVVNEMVEGERERVTAPKPADPQAEFTGKLDAWKAENPWFDADPDLQAFAIGIGESLKATHTPQQQLPIIAQRVKAAFPDKFRTDNPRRTAPAAVEGAQNGRRNTAKTFADLPAEARSMCDRFVKQGFVKDRAAYVASYQWDS